MTAKTASVLNWRVRYAWAPSSTARPMRCMFSVPSVGGQHFLPEHVGQRQCCKGDDGHDGDDK